MNNEIRNAARNNRVRLWEVADRMGIADSALSRRLRHELSPEEKAQILKIIEEVAHDGK